MLPCSFSNTERANYLLSAAIAEGKVLVSVCDEKLFLLNEYVSRLGLHTKAVVDYAAHVTAGLNGEALAAHKLQVSESKVHYQEAHRKYAAHLEKHQC
jgi:hypothetical protein